MCCSTIFVIQQDIDAREDEKPEDDVVLDALSYIAATLSVIGLLLSIFTLLGAK